MATELEKVQQQLQELQQLRTQDRAEIDRLKKQDEEARERQRGKSGITQVKVFDRAKVKEWLDAPQPRTVFFTDPDKIGAEPKFQIYPPLPIAHDALSQETRKNEGLWMRFKRWNKYGAADYLARELPQYRQTGGRPRIDVTRRVYYWDVRWEPAVTITRKEAAELWRELPKDEQEAKVRDGTYKLDDVLRKIQGFQWFARGIVITGEEWRERLALQYDLKWREEDMRQRAVERQAQMRPGARKTGALAAA